MPGRSRKDYEKLGHLLEDLYEGAHASRRLIYKTSFIKGVLGGFGGVLGATILVALIIWLLSLFNHIPLIGPMVESFRRTIAPH